MKRIHTRVKRKYDLTSSHRHHKHFHPGEKTNNTRTFNTEVAAKAHAEANGVATYELTKVKKGKRFMIVPAEKVKDSK